MILARTWPKNRPGASDGGDRACWRVFVAVGALIVLIAGGVVAGLIIADRDGADAMTASSLDLPTLGLFDSFSRPDSTSLGTSESGQQWLEESGDWGIVATEVVISEPNPSAPSIAVVDMRSSEGIVQVTMTRVVRAGGIVFRYENPFNYWALTAAPGSATWSISKVVAGEPSTVGSLGVTPVADNSTIAVRLDEGRIGFFVDGVRRLSLFDRDLLDETLVGLIARGADAADARWTNFVAIAEVD